MALMIEYRIKLLITHSNGEDETRTVRQEGWNASEAIGKAEQRVWDEEPEVEDVRAVEVS